MLERCLAGLAHQIDLTGGPSRVDKPVELGDLTPQPVEHTGEHRDEVDVVGGGVADRVDRPRYRLAVLLEEPAGPVGNAPLVLNEIDQRELDHIVPVKSPHPCRHKVGVERRSERVDDFGECRLHRGCRGGVRVRRQKPRQNGRRRTAPTRRCRATRPERRAPSRAPRESTRAEMHRRSDRPGVGRTS